ncbi:YkyA family protein [Anoxybacteroides amylolyticum]|uniref:Cell-wall binding lipofamily protein n=1 Tax=Anoxybacteroides amylolyticum TaxID=294699 RepID=A0A160F1Y6_9BACL|nr:YkyA family protein [Anoxybacillus amylolyticus]ANB59662.1 cell-wall binding lipofamily protein [Anoxybacillus amylolyticus]
MNVGKCLFVFIVILLQACTTPEQQITRLFEELGKYETNISEHENQLVRLEKNQTALYNDIMTLGMKQVDDIAKLADEAEALIYQREKQLEAEYESIKKATKQMEMINRYTSDIHDETLKQRLHQLIQTGEKRYASYEKLYDHYHTALTAEKKLCRLFKQPDVTLADLQAQIGEVNDAYKKLFSANEQFNEYTQRYNREKKQLYKILP